MRNIFRIAYVRYFATGEGATVALIGGFAPSLEDFFKTYVLKYIDPYYQTDIKLYFKEDIQNIDIDDSLKHYLLAAANAGAGEFIFKLHYNYS